MVIGVKHLPEGRAEDMLTAEDREAKGVGINKLMGVIINTYFTMHFFYHDEKGDQGLFDHIEVLGKSA